MPWGKLHWKPASHIFVRVFGTFGSLLLAMTLLYGFLIIPLQRDSLLKVLSTQGTTVSRSIIQACSTAMLTDDFGFIVDHNLQVVANNKSIKSVLITPKRGGSMRITAAGWGMVPGDGESSAGPRPAAESYELVHEPSGGSYFRFVAPIQFSGIGWGALQIDFDTSEYDASIRAMYVQLAYIAAFALLIVLSIGYLFARWLTDPIQTIGDAAARVGQGDLDVELNIRRRDEIGELAKSFNVMTAALQENRERLRHYNEELERKVAERTHQLDELNRTLDLRVQQEVAERKKQEMILIQQSRLAAMGEMIGAIAHQWRQPLNALNLVFQNIRMQHRAGQLTTESMNRMEEKAARLMERMSATIDEFRNFFKPGKVNTPFNLLRSMTAAGDIMEATLKNHNIQFKIECDESIELCGVSGELSQVWLNLISNAKDALIETCQTEPRITLRAIQLADRVRVQAEDNGGGIPVAVIDRIFEPYFTTKEEGRGSGIGLYMSRMIVQGNLHGHMEAENIDGGARISVEISTQTA